MSKCPNAEKITRILIYLGEECGKKILCQEEPREHTLLGVLEMFAATEAKLAKADTKYKRYNSHTKKTAEVSIVFTCERDNQFHLYDSDLEVARRGMLSLAARMALTGSSLMSPHAPLEARLGVSAKNLVDSILPKTRLLPNDSDFETIEGEPTHPVYFRDNEFCSSQFKVASHKKGGCRVYIDTAGVVGLGKIMAFMRVGDYLPADSDELQQLKELTAKVGKGNSACLLLPLLKHIFDCAIAKAPKEQKENDDHRTARELKDPIDRFIQGLLDSLIKFIDLDAFDPNTAPRFSWLATPPVSSVFEGALDPDTVKRLKAINEASAQRVRAANPDASEEELKRLIVEREINTLMVFYFITIGISQVCSDASTFMMSRSTLQGLCDAEAFVELLEGMPFATLFNALFEICRGVSLNGARALTMVSIMFVSVLKYGGGLPIGDPAALQSFPQVLEKKEHIEHNVPHQIRHRLEEMGVPKEIIEQLCSVPPRLGVDGHVKRFLIAAARVLVPDYGNAKAYERLAYAVAATLSPETAVVANEVLAQLSMWIIERRRKKLCPANGLLLERILGAMRNENKVFRTIVDAWLAAFDKKKT